MSLQIIRRSGQVEALDCTLTYTQGRDGAATRHPIEDGADRSDHLHAEGLVWQIRGMVSLGSGNATAPADWPLLLDTLMLTGELFTILHPRIGSHSRVVLEGYSFPLGADHSIVFTLRLRQLQLSFATSTAIPAAQTMAGAEDIADAASAGKLATTPTSADDQSALLYLSRSLGLTE